jgi:deoxyadenosine/deoxycytidine kinase
VFLLEGNLGAGKSTLIKLIADYAPELTTVLEPVASWHNNNQSQSLLTHFYQDQARWAYTMEKATLLTRVKEYVKEQENLLSPKIMERSLYSGYYCFAKNGYLQGTLSEIEWNIYKNWFNFLVTSKCKKPSGFIYLYTNPETCYTRMHKRKRDGEDIVPLEYLTQIHQAHENFLRHKDVMTELKTVPVLELNGTQDFSNNPEYIADFIQKIRIFIHAHQAYTPFELNQPKKSSFLQA